MERGGEGGKVTYITITESIRFFLLLLFITFLLHGRANTINIAISVLAMISANTVSLKHSACHGYITASLYRGPKCTVSRPTDVCV